MSVNRFYVASVDGLQVELSPEEAHHVLHVRRLQAGDAVELFAEDGQTATGTICKATHRRVWVTVLSRTPCRQRDPVLTLAVAIPKGPRAEWLVEKAAELGVACLWPLCTAHSVGAPAEGRIHKWHRITREANKQCGRADLMRIEQPIDWTIAVSRATDATAVLFCDVLQWSVTAHALPDWLMQERERRKSRQVVPASEPPAPDRYVAFIGPEGGWSESERADAIAAGMQPIRLSEQVLRVETAALAVAAGFAAWSIHSSSNPSQDAP